MYDPCRTKGLLNKPRLDLPDIVLVKRKGKGEARRLNISEVLSSTKQFLKDRQYGERIGN